MAKSQTPWTTDAGRLVRESEKGIAVSLHRTVFTAMAAAMQRRWSTAASLLRVAAGMCDGLEYLHVDIDEEAEAAAMRSREALRKARAPRVLDDLTTRLEGS